ncbi:MAG: RcnB family protein [Vicinamibacterales bacterium]
MSHLLRAAGVAAVGLLWLSSPGAAQQRDQPRQTAHTQFSDHDRQVTKTWYDQHKSRPPVGLRPQDRLTPEQESHLRPGQPLDPALRSRTHPVPSTLARQLPHPPPHHQYVAVGGHVALVDQTSHVVRDVIHLVDDVGGGR